MDLLYHYCENITSVSVIKKSYTNANIELHSDTIDHAKILLTKAEMTGLTCDKNN